MRIVQWIIVNIFLIVGLLCFGISIVYFMNGSFELAPSAEQQEKVKITALFFGIISFCMEVILFLIRLKIKRKTDIEK